MKTVILASLLFSSPLPKNGIYKCIKGNNESICDQKVRVKGNQLSVTYVGDCAGQGPYVYSCYDKICSDEMGVIVFSMKDETHYRWENKQYEFVCDFEKLERLPIQ